MHGLRIWRVVFVVVAATVLMASVNAISDESSDDWRVARAVPRGSLDEGMLDPVVENTSPIVDEPQQEATDALSPEDTEAKEDDVPPVDYSQQPLGEDTLSTDKPIVGKVVQKAVQLGQKVVGQAKISDATSSCDTKIKILTLNLWDDLTHTGGKGVDATAALVKKLNVDVCGFQEVKPDTVKAIAAKLGNGWSYSGNPAFVVTRLKILQTYSWQKTNDAKDSKKPIFGTVELERCPGLSFRFANTHFWADPASTRQLKQGMSADEVLKQALAMHTSGGGIMAAFHAELFNEHCDMDKPTIFVGDHNEPSTLDHTQDTAKSKTYEKARQLKVTVIPWPVSQQTLAKGFKDVYRSLHPDVVKNPGFSYPAKVFPGSVSDRIDYIYTRDGSLNGKMHNFKLLSCDLVTDKDMPAGQKWPSDHWGYQATVQLSQQ